jgi:protein-disulfide isomerase
MKIRRYLTAVIIIIGLLGGTAAGLWLARSAGKPSASVNQQPLRELAQASKGAESPQSKGTETAVVTIEEFADFQCPPCAKLHEEIKSFESEYGSKLRVVHRHFPLETHNHAVAAAQASEAAALQGKFWQMCDLLYEHQEEWGSESVDARQVFAGYAKNLNLDMEKFLRDMDAPETRQRIEADKLRGESINISATPTLFINGSEVPADLMSSEGIKGLINDASR